MKLTSNEVKYTGCQMCKFEVNCSNTWRVIRKNYFLPSFDQPPTHGPKVRADSLLLL